MRHEVQSPFIERPSDAKMDSLTSKNLILRVALLVFPPKTGEEKGASIHWTLSESQVFISPHTNILLMPGAPLKQERSNSYTENTFRTQLSNPRSTKARESDPVTKTKSSKEHQDNAENVPDALPPNWWWSWTLEVSWIVLLPPLSIPSIII